MCLVSGAGGVLYGVLWTVCVGGYGLLTHLEFDGAKPFKSPYSDCLFLQQFITSETYRTVFWCEENKPCSPVLWSLGGSFSADNNRLA